MECEIKTRLTIHPSNSTLHQITILPYPTNLIIIDSFQQAGREIGRWIVVGEEAAIGSDDIDMSYPSTASQVHDGCIPMASMYV